MSKRAMQDIREMLCKEMDEIAQKGEMSAGDLETVHKLTATIKNIDKICMFEDGGYSQDGNWSAEMRGDYGNSYNDGGGYSGRHWVRGHYSREGGGYSGDGNYSNRRGYSRTGDIRERLEQMMNEAGSNKEKDAIRRAMQELN